MEVHILNRLSIVTYHSSSFYHQLVYSLQFVKSNIQCLRILNNKYSLSLFLWIIKQEIVYPLGFKPIDSTIIIY